MNKPITTRVNQSTSLGMVKSGAKQIVEDKTKEGTELGLNTGQRYVSKDGFIQIETPGSEGTPDKIVPGKNVEKLETDNQKYLDSFKPGFKRDNEGFDNIEDYRKNKEKKYKPTVEKGKPATGNTYEHIPSSTEGTEGTPGKDAVKEKKGDSFNAYQQRNVNRKGLNLNRISKKGGKKELREEKKQAKAGLKAATGANFFQRTFGTGKGKDYRQGVKDFNKGKFNSEALSKDGVGDFGYSADEAKKAKITALGGSKIKDSKGNETQVGFSLMDYNKAAGDHAMKQTSQGIRGKTAGEHIASGTTGANRVTTQEYQPAVASTSGTPGTTSERTIDNAANRAKFNMNNKQTVQSSQKADSSQGSKKSSSSSVFSHIPGPKPPDTTFKKRGYKQTSPTSAAMKKYCSKK